MGVGSISSIVSEAATESSAGILVARKALDVQEQQGQAIVRLMESSKVEGPKGNNVDVFA
ncbi:MAG: YjfB family protein [Syntrophobacter sp.]